jgi:hypothetical protein
MSNASVIDPDYFAKTEKVYPNQLLYKTMALFIHTGLIFWKRVERDVS